MMSSTPLVALTCNVSWFFYTYKELLTKVYTHMQYMQDTMFFIITIKNLVDNLYKI